MSEPLDLEPIKEMRRRQGLDVDYWPDVTIDALIAEVERLRECLAMAASHGRSVVAWALDEDDD